MTVNRKYQAISNKTQEDIMENDAPRRFRGQPGKAFSYLGKRDFKPSFYKLTDRHGRMVFQQARTRML